MSTKYQIHNNGGRCFLVEDFYEEKYLVISVAYIDEDLSYEEYLDILKESSIKGGVCWYSLDESVFTELCTIDYIAFYPGKDYSEESDVGAGYSDSDGGCDGNNCLVQISETKFIQISEIIFLFTLPKSEKIEEYISFVGHSDTPRAYLVTNKNYIFLDECSIYNRKKLDNVENCEISEKSPYLRHFTCGRSVGYKKLKTKTLFSAIIKQLKFPSNAVIKNIPVEFFKENFHKKFWEEQNKYGW